jgi:hypothetical protein
MTSFLVGYDFYYLWAAGKTLQQGGNPYDLHQLNHQLATLNWPAEEVAQGLTHPPTNLWLYWLMAQLPFEIAMPIFMIGSLAIVVACAIALTPLVAPGRPPARHFVLVSTLMFPPVLSNVIWGQVNVVLLLGLTLFALFFRRGSYFAAGLGSSLVLMKPHIFAPLLVVVTLWELSHRRIGVVCGLVAGLILQASATYLINPHVFIWYAEYVPVVIAESSRICGATLGQMIECETGWEAIRPLLLVIGCVAGVVLTQRQGYSLRTLLCVLTPLSVLVAPYAWSHTFIVLVPALVVALAPLVERLGEKRVVYLLTGLCIATTPFIVNAHVQYLWIAIPFVLFGVNMRAVAYTGAERGAS